MKNVLVVPEQKQSLILISALARAQQKIVFNDDYVLIYRNHKLSGKQMLNMRLYELEIKVPSTCYAYLMNRTIMHRRYCHPCITSMGFFLKKKY
jgi:hypothetical protein